MKFSLHDVLLVLSGQSVAEYPGTFNRLDGRESSGAVATDTDCRLAIANWSLAKDSIENRQLEIGNAIILKSFPDCATLASL
jgi:hypothetical protein